MAKNKSFPEFRQFGKKVFLFTSEEDKYIVLGVSSIEEAESKDSTLYELVTDSSDKGQYCYFVALPTTAPCAFKIRSK